VSIPLSNARASLIRSLHRNKGRAAEGAFLAEGERLLSELPREDGPPRWFFAVEERIEWIEERFPDAEIHVVGRNESKLFATDNAQGVGAVVEMLPPPSLRTLAASDRPLLLLDALADPGNVGTIIRTAEWFGIGGVLLGAGSVDLYNPKTVRATMGAIFRMPVVENLEPADALGLERPLYALDASASDVLGTITLPHNGVYVIGGEAHGIKGELLAVSSAVAIRGAGRIESLNAAIAASILCYELTRVEQPT
jgi:TrmH family RNA methyltransferase